MKKNVLIVEDNELNLEVLVGVLRVFDVELTSAETGTKGLDAVQSAKFDLVLLDLQLPELDGEAILTAMRSDSSLASVPVVVVTAKAMRGERERILEHGANDYVAKPIEIAPMRELLDEYLDRRESAGRKPA